MSANESHRDESLVEKGAIAKEPTVTECVQDEEALDMRPANGVNFGALAINVVIAITPLYFVAFGILVYLRRNTPSNTFLNQAILRMAGYNPTIFPILFAVIATRFIKSVANWYLEKGTTVGRIEHLLGSRSLVSSVLTPMKVKATGIWVPVLIIFWVLNPIGGQTALRVASKSSNYQTSEMPFHYIDPGLGFFTAIIPSSPNYFDAITPANAAFAEALLSPASSKNGTQDQFGNIQIPMIEPLRLQQSPDVDGWFTTTANPILNNSLGEAVADWLDLPQTAQPIYASMTGIPFLWDRSAVQVDNSSNLTSTLDKIESAIFGSDVINMQAQFNMELSYFYTNCTVRHKPQGSLTSYQVDSNDNFTTWKNASNAVANYQGLSIWFDNEHTKNSSRPRIIGFESWLRDTAAWCSLTTTYLEAQVFCTSGSTCGVIAIRDSTENHRSRNVSALDGFAIEPGVNAEYVSDMEALVAQQFFAAFVNATQPTVSALVKYPSSPIERYFVRPANPMIIDESPLDDEEIYQIGDTLFSERFSQLLNTYWLDSIAMYAVTGSFQNPTLEGIVVSNSTGEVRVQESVLRCHIPFLAIMLLVSALLFAAAAVTAYLEAVRRGPDVLDNFVNSLRHSPFVHVEQGPSMEDGAEKAARLRAINIRIGDVRPDDPVGYVAIATPGNEQPVHELDRARKYA